MKNRVGLSWISLLLIMHVFPGVSQSGFMGNKELRALHASRQVPYHLPYNQFVFDFTFDFTLILPGRFADHAEQLLGISGTERDTIRSVHLAALELNMITAPDPGARFVFQEASDKPYPYFFKINDNQVLQYAGSRQAWDGVVPGSYAPPVISKVFAPRQAVRRVQPLEAMDLKKPMVVRQIIDTAGNRVDIKVPQEETAEQKLAREIAGRILELQSARTKLLSGYQEIPYSYDAISYMDQGLQRLQRDYMSLFAGDTVSYTEHTRVIFSPEKGEEDTWVLLFRLDPKLGILPVSARSGELCKLRFTYAIPLESDSVHHVDKDSLVKSMIYYREPAEIRLELMLGEQHLMSQLYLVSQLGKLNAIPLKGTNILLDQVTGAPVEIFFRNKK